MKHSILVLALTFALPCLARAEGTPPPANNVEKREENQEKRIEQGVQNGSLTKHEARKLGREQKRIEGAEQRAEADGNVSAKEARHLRKMQNHASRDIQRKKHNRRQR